MSGLSWLRWLINAWIVVFWVRTLWRAGWRSPSRWVMGWSGKGAALLVILLLWCYVFGFWVPVGAAIVAWRIRRRSDPFELPMADGRWAR